MLLELKIVGGHPTTTRLREEVLKPRKIKGSL
jgi:hypothetical protein